MKVTIETSNTINFIRLFGFQRLITYLLMNVTIATSKTIKINGFVLKKANNEFGCLTFNKVGG